MRATGPFDLDEEQPPPSAIARRRDTVSRPKCLEISKDVTFLSSFQRESVALIKKMIYYTAPVTHKTVPKIRTSDAIKAAFDPEDHLTRPPRQSVSEEQVHPRVIPWHGVRLWQSLVS